MTSISGYELVASPCCRKIYGTPRYASINFSASAYWTDGKRENSLMPNDGGLRKCECGEFFTLLDCLKIGLNADEKAIFPERVHPSELPHAIKSTISINVEIAARRAYWIFLNDEYRELYKAHREEEDLNRKILWVEKWELENPDRRSKLKKIFDKLLLRKKPAVPSTPNEPITFPTFQPTDVQMENMLHLVELIQANSENFTKEYPVELAELYRELGKYDEAKALLENVSTENQDFVTNLILELCNERQSAPVRYRY